MSRILGSTVLRAVGVGRFDVEKIVDILRGRIDSIPGLRAVKWGSSRLGLVPGARSEVVVLCRVSPADPLLPGRVFTLWKRGVEGSAGS